MSLPCLKSSMATLLSKSKARLMRPSPLPYTPSFLLYLEFCAFPLMSPRQIKLSNGMLLSRFASPPFFIIQAPGGWVISLQDPSGRVSAPTLFFLKSALVVLYDFQVHVHYTTSLLIFIKDLPKTFFFFLTLWLKICWICRSIQGEYWIFQSMNTVLLSI